MNDFVATYPGVIISLLSALVGFISLLLGLLFRSVIRSNEDLTAEVKGLKQLIGPLFDRMTAMETRCSEREKYCPTHRN